ncbi:hypothetical protein V8C86DRAFT_1834790, partial [Haematococcus lacustris]
MKRLLLLSRYILTTSASATGSTCRLYLCHTGRAMSTRENEAMRAVLSSCLPRTRMSGAPRSTSPEVASSISCRAVDPCGPPQLNAFLCCPPSPW